MAGSTAYEFYHTHFPHTNTKEGSTATIALAMVHVRRTMEHLGYAGDKAYCDNLACWCHTDVGYHEHVTGPLGQEVSEGDLQAMYAELEDSSEVIVFQGELIGK